MLRVEVRGCARALLGVGNLVDEGWSGRRIKLR